MSLFEITIVMLVLGIVAAIAAPRFADSFQSSKLVAAANQIAGEIDYIRRAALNEGRTTTLHCDSDADRYWSNEVLFPHVPGQLIDVDVKAVHHPEFELTADFDGQTSLAFDMEGVPHAGGSAMKTGSIRLSAGGRTLIIGIAAGTGETTVSEQQRNDGNVLNEYPSPPHGYPSPDEYDGYYDGLETY